MLLSETVEGLYGTPLFMYDPDTAVWVKQPMPCTLAAYDRFISDRAFGQKKRLLQTPGGHPLVHLDKYYRAGSADSESTFIIESQNPDLNENGTYLHVYMLREVAHPMQVEVWGEEETLASGVKQRKRVLLPEVHWCDLERYGSSNSSELPTTYTSYTLTTSRSVTLPEDCKVRVSLGYRLLEFGITERFDLMNSVQVRAREWDGPR